MVEAKARLAAAVGFVVGKVQPRDRRLKPIFTRLLTMIRELTVGDELRLLFLLSPATEAYDDEDGGED